MPAIAAAWSAPWRRRLLRCFLQPSMLAPERARLQTGPGTHAGVIAAALALCAPNTRDATLETPSCSAQCLLASIAMRPRREPHSRRRSARPNRAPLPPRDTTPMQYGLGFINHHPELFAERVGRRASSPLLALLTRQVSVQR